MSAASVDSANALAPREARLDRLLGRQVRAPNNHAVGRLEEFRAEKRGTGLVVTEYVIGFGGLFERLHVGFRLLFGGRARGYVARWDQIDVTNPERPRLTCSAGELRKL